MINVGVNEDGNVHFTGNFEFRMSFHLKLN